MATVNTMNRPSLSFLSILFGPNCQISNYASMLRLLISTMYYVKYSLQQSVADALKPTLCALNHIKGAVVWPVCGLPLGDGRGRRKQISFLDLGPSFLCTLHPSLWLSFIWATSRVSRMTARLCCSKQRRIYSDEKSLHGSRCITGNKRYVLREVEVDVVKMTSSSLKILRM